MSNKVFEFDTRQGSLKDRISGDIPNNTGRIKRTSRGRAVFLDGAEIIDFQIANFRSADSMGAVIVNFVLSDFSATKQTLMGSGDQDSPDNWMWLFIVGSTGQIIFNQRNNNDTIDKITINVTGWNDGQFHQLEFGSTGSAYYVLIDNVSHSFTVTGGSNSGDWFAETSSRDNITIGAFKRTTTDLFFSGYISSVIIVDEPPTTAERNERFQTFLSAQNIGVSLITNRGDASMIFYETLLSEDADGVVYSAGQYTQNWYVVSGNVRCLEDSTGKYLECTSDAVLQHKGVDLSVLTDNGTITEGEGYLSSLVERTVTSVSGDASPLLSWAGNILTLNMSTNDKLRKLAIKGA